MLPNTGGDVSSFPLASKFSLCSLNRGVSQIQNPILSIYFLGQRVITIFMSVKIPERNRWHTKIGLFKESFKIGLFTRVWVGFRESTQRVIVPSSWEQRGTVTTPRPQRAMRISFQNWKRDAVCTEPDHLYFHPACPWQPYRKGARRIIWTLLLGITIEWIQLEAQGQGHPRM